MGKSTIYVTGHRNPDSDSIISAMAYAYFKQQMGFDAIAVRLGELNNETKYILNYFNEFAPPIVKDIKTRIRDIEFDDVVTCLRDDTIADALKLMREHDKRVIAVTTNRLHLRGILSISDITDLLIPRNEKLTNILKQTSVGEIANFLSASKVYADKTRLTNGEINVVIEKIDKNVADSIVITSCNEKLICDIIANKPAVIIVTNTEYVSEETKMIAKEQDVCLLNSPLDMYDIIKSLPLAAKVETIMSTNMITFKYDDYVENVKRKINKSRFRSYPIIDARKHVIGTISRYHVLQHATRNLIMVDHNEFDQSIEGVEEANILEIIDHHRIGGVKTASPVTFRNEQTGCCATIITKIFMENNIEIPQTLAGLLCSAIISDTVNFKSVTCTKQDEETAKMLAKKAKISLRELGPKILVAGVSLEDKSINEIFNTDLKAFTINKMKVVVAQTNVVDYNSFAPILSSMKDKVSQYSQDSGANIVLMVFTLIDGTGSYVIPGGKDVNQLESAFSKYGQIKDDLVFLNGFISRKSQLVPMITEALEEEN